MKNIRFDELENESLIIKSNNMLNFKLHIQKAEEGGYNVSVPALPGCFTQGETIDEAVLMAKEAIEIYIEELQERGETILDNSETLEYSLNLELK